MNGSRQFPEKIIVDKFAGERLAENFGIDADDDGSEAQLNEGANQFARIASPDGEQALHSALSQICFPGFAQVFKENVSKRHPLDAALPESVERPLHSECILAICALLRHRHVI